MARTAHETNELQITTRTQYTKYTRKKICIEENGNSTAQHNTHTHKTKQKRETKETPKKAFTAV